MDFHAFSSRAPVAGEALILSHLPENDWRGCFIFTLSKNFKECIQGHWFCHNEEAHNHPPICMRDALPARGLQENTFKHQPLRIIYGD